MPEQIFIALSTFAKDDAYPQQILSQSALPFSLNMTGKRLTKDLLIDMAREATAIVAGLEIYDELTLKALPKLRCISRCGVGVDNIDLAFAKSRGIRVFNTPKAVIVPVAEMTLALIFTLLRQTHTHSQAMSQGKWERQTGRQLSGQTVGLIGLGRIGRYTATLLKALGTTVIAYDPFIDVQWCKDNGVASVSYEHLLASSDIVSLHLAGQDQNPFKMTLTDFKRMKPKALLINTARGAFIDENGLFEAIKQGHLGGAALDVFSEEPYQGPLSLLPEVLLSPHCATLTVESRRDMETEAVSQAIAFLKGEST